jgi:6-phosphogluconate dehydrogenase (decarboxylating)
MFSNESRNDLMNKPSCGLLVDTTIVGTAFILQENGDDIQVFVRNILRDYLEKQIVIEGQNTILKDLVGKSVQWKKQEIKYIDS